MLVDELTIRQFRGIRDLTLRPAGKNLAIWGPNGTGKSGVIDALDFLFRGDISRLRGPGSGDVSQTRHGRHVDAKVSDARVEALVRLTATGSSFRIGRALETPNELECSDDSMIPHLERMHSLAQRGQNILTRRDILRFIAVTPGERAKQIEELLDLSDIGAARRMLRTLAGDLHGAAENATARSADERARAASAIGARGSYDASEIAALVNTQRAILGLQPIDVIEPTGILSGLAPNQTLPMTAAISPTLHSDLANLRTLAGSYDAAAILADYTEIQEALQRLSTDAARASLQEAQLIEQGVALLDDAARCPLCDTEWASPELLAAHLNEKLRAARESVALNNKLTQDGARLAARLRPLAAALHTMLPGLERTGSTAAADVAALDLELQTVLDAAPVLARQLALPVIPAVCLRNDSLDALVSKIASSIPVSQDASTPDPAKARELLTRFDERLQSLRAHEETETLARAASAAAASLLNHFVAARDAVLNALYASVQQRFVELYRALHAEETGSFSAALAPTNTGMRFEVDFHGRGSFPPIAVHSEGHQDSMGLCLFLALSEQLAQGPPDLLLLDDVVMSVDHDHRKDICNVLRTEFPSTQLVITTHDKTWASQLRALGVVDAQNLIEFPSWSIENGPTFAVAGDLWSRIDEHLGRADVPAAAAALRRGCEEFFESACNALHARVPYRSDYRWDFGDWVSSAMTEYKELLGAARKSAGSWSDQDRVTAFGEAESIRRQVWSRVWEEAWAINPNVHFDRWNSLQADEFRAVVDAYRDLISLFACSSCGGLMETTFANDRTAQVACRCGRQTWNLRLKG